MNWLNKKTIFVLLLLGPVYFFLLSIHAGPGLASDVEVWELKLTGDTEGEFKMQVKLVETEKGFSEISGEFSGPMNDRLFGRGEMSCWLKGKIEQDVFEAKLSGFAEVASGMVSLRGSIRGTVTRFDGSGTWNILHDWGSPEGKWVTKRTTVPQE